MGRPALGARLRDRLADGRAKWSWQSYRGGPESYEVFHHSPELLKRFRAHVLECWDSGEVPMKPSEFFGPPTATTVVTIKAFIGEPSKNNPGAFFEKHQSMAKQNRDSYELPMKKHEIFELLDKPMASLTSEDAQAVVWRMVRCVSCHTRSKRSRPDERLRVDHPAFDGDCPNHRAALRRTTVRKYLGKLSAVYKAGVRAGHVPAGNTDPFRNALIPTWDEPVTNNDITSALRLDQHERFVAAHPDFLQVIPEVSTTGMLRSGEFWGLTRNSFPVPPEDPADDPPLIRTGVTRAWNASQNCYSPRGKTPGSVGPVVDIVLPLSAVKVVNRHLREHMPPNPTLCASCSDGARTWREDGPNPHRDCGFADDTPLVHVRAAHQPLGYNGPQISPDDYRDLLKAVGEESGLREELGFRITHKVCRMTGATLHVHFGTPIDEVKLLGRWTNTETITRHYHRLYGGAREEAAVRANRAWALHVGDNPPDEASEPELIKFYRRRNAELEAELARLQGCHAGETRPCDKNDVQQRVARRIPQVVSVFSDTEAVRHAVAEGSSRGAICKQLGVAAAGSNYARLERVCAEHGIELPEKRRTGPRRSTA